MAGIDTYRAGLRSAVRGLWSGVFSLSQFQDEMRTLINRRLTQAFDEGAAECGITPDEFTTEEQLALARAIQEELSHVRELANRIEANSKASKGKLTPLLNRVSTLWLNRYRDLNNLARQITCKNVKLVWSVGPTEHCKTCARLNGKVKRASTWKRLGLRPQHPPNNRLECQGYLCQCTLARTNLPISKGPLPKTP